MEPTRTSAIEYIGLSMVLSMLGLGVLAAVAPESYLRAIVRTLLGWAGAV